MTRALPLSPFFSWVEVEASATAKNKGIVNVLPEELQANAARSAQMMESIRAVLGEPVVVSSWYRCLELNRAVGSKDDSKHLLALAVDWVPTKATLNQAFDRILGSALPFDQLIIERTASGSEWIHVGLSLKPHRREALRATGDLLGGAMTFTRVASG